MCFVKKACTMWIKVEECSLPDMNKVLISHGKNFTKNEKNILFKGWITNAHVEEIVYLGGAEMCCELGNCRALSHLEMVSDEAIRYYQPFDF